MTTYTLEAIHDSRQSFYGKAHIKEENGRKTLISYTTEIAYIENGTAHIINAPKFDTPTSMRHIREFLYQNGFKVGTKKELLKWYM